MDSNEIIAVESVSKETDESETGRIRYFDFHLWCCVCFAYKFLVDPKVLSFGDLLLAVASIASRIPMVMVCQVMD